MATKSRFSFRLKALPVVILAAFTLGGLASCGGGDADTVVPLPPVIDAEANTGSIALSWAERIAESLHEVALGVAAMAEGNFVAGGSEFAAAFFGVVSKGLESGESGDDQAKKLNEINSKLDTVLLDVESLANQMGEVEKEITGLADFVKNEDALGQYLYDAQQWLDKYYTSPKSSKSREWARWYTAGCKSGLTGYTCPSASNPATADDLEAFRKNFMRDLTKKIPFQEDNFPLWWAYGVYGDHGYESFKINYIASDNEANLYKGLTKGLTQDKLFTTNDKNGLVSYMDEVRNAGSCKDDVTAKDCDLYRDVYLPVEAYFSLIIGVQSQLVMAQVEALTVMAQHNPDSFSDIAKQVMPNFNQHLNEEVEAFLQVAEQIALYRAADGRTDWSNFADTDAGKLLARADFIAMQLAGKNYRTTSTTPAWIEGYVNPPWPSDGIVGRVFYAQGERQLANTGGRWVCADNNYANCYSGLTQFGENDDSTRIVNGVQPYLLWTSTVDAKTGGVLITGTANTQWTVKRLKPMAATTLPAGANYLVNSTHADQEIPDFLVHSPHFTDKMPAKFAFNNYDQNFVTPPGPDTRPKDKDGNLIAPVWSKAFGSFSSVEGDIGRYGLQLNRQSFPAVVDKMPSVVYDSDYGANSSIPGATNFNLKYLANPDFGSNYDGAGVTSGTWTATTVPVKLVIPTAIARRNVKLSWPSTLKVNLDSKYRSDYRFLDSVGIQTEYYSNADFKQEILSDGQTLENGLSLTQCSPTYKSYSYPFFSCQIDKDQSVDVSFLMGKATEKSLTFSANFNTEVSQLDHFYADNGGRRYKLQRTSIDPSVAKWEIRAPMLTLTR